MKRKSLTRIFHRVYKNVIAEQQHEVNFWVLIAFIITFSISRLIVYYFPGLYIPWREEHVHHFAYGIIILAVVGLMALNNWHHRKRRSFGIMYGIGLGLAMDEFGMWIHLNDDYWIRHSYDAIFITGAILIFTVYFSDFFLRVIKKLLQSEDEDSD